MPSETDPLLHEESDSERSARGISTPAADSDETAVPNPISPYYIPVVAFLARLCFFIPTTTIVEILLELTCRLYWNYSGTEPPISEDKCTHPSVRQYFIILNTAVGVMDGLGGLVMYGPLGRLSGKYGRRSMMVVLTVLIILNSLCLIGAYKLAIGFTAPLLLLWLVLASATGPWEIDIMTVMYVVDTTATKKRTSMLSVVMGCAYVAGIPAFAIGGWLTTWTQDDAVVYWAVIGIALFLLAYIAFILPESFDHARREKLASEWKNERERSGRGTGYLNSALETFFQHLTLLKPHRDPVTGRWNLRLLWCGVHAFLSALASGYLINSILIYLALHMRYKPDENGYTLTVSAIATGFSLIIVTPLLIKWGRHFYGFAYKHTTNPSVKRDTRNSLINAKLDKHLAIFGWTIDILSMAFLPLARTRMQVTISLMVLGASYFRISTFRSVVVASGDSIRSGEILAAIQTLTALGTALSGLVLGSVLSASIDTFPGLVFLVYSAIAFVSVVALCLIKDSDRYIAPLATDS